MNRRRHAVHNKKSVTVSKDSRGRRVLKDKKTVGKVKARASDRAEAVLEKATRATKAGNSRSRTSEHGVEGSNGSEGGSRDGSDGEASDTGRMSSGGEDDEDGEGTHGVSGRVSGMWPIYRALESRC